jgi:hypothetical protein
MLIGNMNTPYGKAQIHIGRYPVKKAISVQLIDSENGYEPLGTLSVNLPEKNHLLGAGEFFAKIWNENVSLIRPALKSGFFIDTGRTVPTGFVYASIWRLNVDGAILSKI